MQQAEYQQCCALIELLELQCHRPRLQISALTFERKAIVAALRTAETSRPVTVTSLVDALQTERWTHLHRHRAVGLRRELKLVGDQLDELVRELTKLECKIDHIAQERDRLRQCLTLKLEADQAESTLSLWRMGRDPKVS